MRDHHRMKDTIKGLSIAGFFCLTNLGLFPLGVKVKSTKAISIGESLAKGRLATVTGLTYYIYLPFRKVRWIAN